MNYRDKVTKYFDFTSGIEIIVGNQNKKNINITGKPTKRMIKFFLGFVGFIYAICIYFNIFAIINSALTSTKKLFSL